MHLLVNEDLVGVRFDLSRQIGERDLRGALVVLRLAQGLAIDTRNRLEDRA